MVSNVRKFVIVTSWAMSERDYERFGCSYFESKGYEIQVFDAMDICFPGVRESIIQQNNSFRHTKKLDSWTECENFFQKLQEHDTIMLSISFNKSTRPFFKILKLCNAKVGWIQIGAFPPSVGSIRSFTQLTKIKSSILKILIRVLKTKVILFARQLANSFSSIGFNLRNPDFYLTSGPGANLALPFIQSKYSILEGHSQDFEIAHTMQDKLENRYSNYAVFLDEYLPFHPDFIVEGSPPPIGQEKYFYLLNKFFTHVENQFKLQVIIAAHPRADLKCYSRYFEGRSVIQSHTSELVKYSDLVIAHGSTSLSYAAIFRKRISLITFEEFNNSNEGPFIHLMGNWIGEVPILLNKMDKYCEVFNTLPDVKIEYLRRYELEFLSWKGVFERPLWDILKWQIDSRAEGNLIGINHTAGKGERNESK